MRKNRKEKRGEKRGKVIFTRDISSKKKPSVFPGALRKQGNIRRKISFLFLFSINLKTIEISFLVPISIDQFFQGIVEQRHRTRRGPTRCFFFFDRMTVSLKARDQPTQLAHFQLSFVNFECARGRLNPDLVCTFPVQIGGEGPRYLLPRREIVTHRSRLVFRSNEILTRPIPTLHVVNLLSSFTICTTVLFHSPFRVVVSRLTSFPPDLCFLFFCFYHFLLFYLRVLNKIYSYSWIMCDWQMDTRYERIGYS